MKRIISKHNIIVCTCMQAKGKLSDYKFKQVIVDESTKASEYEIILALIKAE